MKNGRLWVWMALVALSAPLSAQTGVVQAEDTLARQVRDSVPPLVEVAADTLRADTLYIGELVPDTLAVPDSLRADTLAVPDTIALPDTLRADTVALADSLPADSLAKPAAPPKKVKKKKPTLSKLLSQYCVLKLTPVPGSDEMRLDTVSLLYGKHIGVLDYLNDPDTPERYIAPDPKYFRLFLPFTYYYSPIGRFSTFDWKPASTADTLFADWTRRELPVDKRPFTAFEQANATVDRALLDTYIYHPDFVVMTEDEIMQTRVFRDDIQKEASSRPSVTNLMHRKKAEFNEEAGVVIRKPNWWITSGNGSLQFTQNSISRNWYKGGESSVAVLLNLLLRANYDDKERVQWENLLEIKSNVNSAPSDTCHNFLVTSDQLRLYSKLGVKAINKWYYTISTELKTQVLNAYGTNSNEVKAAFLAPLDWSTSVGMDYKLEKTKYKLSVFLAPLTHTMRFVGDRRVSETSYGLDEGAWVKHDFGSQVQTNLQWTIIPAIKLTSRLDYLTSYKWVRVEWETNVDFIVTKYISARFYVLARFDDSAAPTVGDDYFQATETFGFGLNYAW